MVSAVRALLVLVVVREGIVVTGWRQTNEADRGINMLYHLACMERCGDRAATGDTHMASSRVSREGQWWWG